MDHVAVLHPAYTVAWYFGKFNDKVKGYVV